KVDHKTNALLDSRAEGVFIDQNYAQLIGTNYIKLKELIPVVNVDGTQNKQGTITHYMELTTTIGKRTWTQQYLITGLSKQTVILGFTWLNNMNPEIDWKHGQINWHKG
ncbi:hypothetical protein M413DRAFT_40333, partial [Hebeloma cylindrosporum]